MGGAGQIFNQEYKERSVVSEILIKAIEATMADLEAIERKIPSDAYDWGSDMLAIMHRYFSTVDWNRVGGAGVDTNTGQNVPRGALVADANAGRMVPDQARAQEELVFFTDSNAVPTASGQSIPNTNPTVSRAPNTDTNAIPTTTTTRGGGVDSQVLLCCISSALFSDFKIASFSGKGGGAERRT